MHTLRDFLHSAPREATPMHTLSGSEPLPDNEPLLRTVLVQTSSYRRFALALLFADALLLGATLYSTVDNFLALHAACLGSGGDGSMFDVHSNALTSALCVGTGTLIAFYVIGAILFCVFGATIVAHVHYVRVAANIDATGSPIWHARIGAQLLIATTLLLYVLYYALTLHSVARGAALASLGFYFDANTLPLLAASLVYKLTVACVAAKHWQTLKAHLEFLQEHILQLEDQLSGTDPAAAAFDVPVPRNATGGGWTQISLDEPPPDTETTMYRLPSAGKPRHLRQESDNDGLQVRLVPFDSSTSSGGGGGGGGTTAPFDASTDYASRYGTVRRRNEYLDSPRRADETAMSSDQQRFLCGEESETRYAP